jgi:hypothetical protein
MSAFVSPFGKLGNSDTVSLDLLDSELKILIEGLLTIIEENESMMKIQNELILKLSEKK